MEYELLPEFDPQSKNFFLWIRLHTEEAWAECIFFFFVLSGCQGVFSEEQRSTGCSYVLPRNEKEGSGLGIVQVGRSDITFHIEKQMHIQSSKICTLCQITEGVWQQYSIHNYVLSRSQNNAKMTDFFRNNFTEDRWRKAALKNAFSLLGKQRFQHSAAFFLLAGSLKDAVEASGK